MCTALTYRTEDFYFGRTLDYEISFDEVITVLPRRFPLTFRHTAPLPAHHAMIGITAGERLSGNYPLYYDAVNEKGLCMAGLNFVGNAVYRPPEDGRINIAQFEFLPYILGRCASVTEARAVLREVSITDTPFSRQLPPAQLHWMIADREDCITVESVEGGLMVYDNPVGVLTNNPPFPLQMHRLADFMSLSPKEPVNRFSDKIPLQTYSRGMGAMGLPGDLSSQSRFVRCAFTKLNAVSGTSEEESVGQFFNILGSVEMVRGCCLLADGTPDITVYTSCCNARRGIYYTTTYGNRQISAVDMHREDLDGTTAVHFPLVKEEQIAFRN